MTPQMAARSTLSDKLEASMSTLVPVTALLTPAVQRVRVGDGGAVLGAKAPKVTQNNNTQITQ